MSRDVRCAIVSVLVLAACACGPIGGVASFWKGYRREFIVGQRSDQGPWGGWRWIQWHAEAPGTFQEAAVKDFAERSGWKCAQRDEYSATSVGTWVTFKGEPIFPLLFPMDHEPGYYGESLRFPRRIASDSVVLKCETNWIRKNPAGMQPDFVMAYGLIHLDKDGREMAVYHLWGE